MSRKIFLLIVFSAAFLFLLNGCSSSEKITTKNINGKIYSLGSEPFTGLGLEDSGGTAYRIMESSPVYEKLGNEKGRYISVTIDTKKSDKWDYIFIIDYKIIK